jgi:hypothetical protein
VLPVLVVVPRRPGPLIIPPASAPMARDEIDIGLDELFGEPIQQKPGPLDATLVVGGIAVVIVAEAFLGGGWLVWVGGIAVLLGLALPARSLWRELLRRRSARRLASTLKQGDPLNLSNKMTHRLATAYSEIERAAAEGDDPALTDAVEASLQAVQEVAGLLHGRAPRGAAELEYVGRRAVAVEDLARFVHAGHEGSQAGELSSGRTPRDVAVQAIAEFEERTGVSSLDRIEGIRQATRPPQGK